MSGKSPPFRMTPVVFHVLLSLADGPLHAYGVMKAIEERSEGQVTVAPGSLHFTLRKLENAGWVVQTDRTPAGADDDPRRKYYGLTSAGRAALSAEATLMAEMVAYARRRDLVVEGGTE